MDLSNDDSSGLLEFAKKLARLGGKEALKYFRQPSLKFQSKLEQKLDPIIATFFFGLNSRELKKFLFCKTINIKRSLKFKFKIIYLNLL